MPVEPIAFAIIFNLAAAGIALLLLITEWMQP